jgi:hypothetical protein
LVRNLNNDNDIDNIKKDHKEFAQDDKLYEFEIIFCPYAVIKPLTMMIKILDTSMALVAMERVVTDAGFTQVTKVFMFFG